MWEEGEAAHLVDTCGALCSLLVEESLRDISEWL